MLIIFFTEKASLNIWLTYKIITYYFKENKNKFTVSVYMKIDRGIVFYDFNCIIKENKKRRQR